MKKLIPFVVLFILLCLSCNKSSNSNNSNDGTYKGDIKAYINGTLNSTGYGRTITFTSSSSGKINITNNVMMSTSADLSGNMLTIPRTTVTSSQAFNGVEYGTGIFSGNTITIDFHQDLLNPTTNALIGSGNWKGTLTKL